MLVLGLLESAGSPLSAYDLRSRMVAEGCKVAAMQIYRILHRLIAERRVRRVELLAAYILEPPDADALFICSRCRHVIGVSLEGMDSVLVKAAAAHSFRVERQVIEISGRCIDCTELRPRTAKDESDFSRGADL